MPGKILVVLSSGSMSREGTVFIVTGDLFGNLIHISCKDETLAHAMGISDRFKSSASKTQII